MRGLKALLAAAVVAGVSWFAPAAHAACHAFNFEDTTLSGNEGNSVTVYIERDGAVQDSSVKVLSVTGSATSGTDFTAVNRRVLFTGEEVKKSIVVMTKEDTKDEPNETFQLKLSDGQGCSNTNYTYGGNATITVNDDDAAPTPAPTTAPTTAPTQAPTAQPSASPTPTPTGSPTPTPTGSVTPSPTPSESAPSFTPIEVQEDDDDGFPWIPVVAIAGFLAAAGGALALMRMRTAGGGG